MDRMSQPRSIPQWLSRRRSNAPELLGILFVCVCAVTLASVSIYTDAESVPVPAAPRFGMQQTTPDRGTRVSFLGDGDTVGLGAPRGLGYAYRMSWRMCWVQNINGQTGSGYTSGGNESSSYSSYLARIPDVLASRPQLVVIQGGGDAEPAAVSMAARTVFQAIIREQESVKLAVLLPISKPSTRINEGTKRAIRQVAREYGIRTYDPNQLGWVKREKDFDAKGQYLSPQGHRRLGAAFARALIADNVLPRIDSCGRGNA